MQKLCPICQTVNDAIGFDLSERELDNLHRLSLSEHLCKTCYNKELAALATATKAELIPLHKQKEITQTTYYAAYKAWKTKADLFALIDYNLAVSKFNIQRKEAIKIKKITPSKEPIDIEVLANQILASLTKEQQDAILRTFQANAN